MINNKDSNIFYVQNYTDVCSFVYVNYGRYMYTVQYNRETGQTNLVGTNSSFKKLEQEDMDALADICYEYFNSEV